MESIDKDNIWIYRVSAAWRRLPAIVAIMVAIFVLAIALGPARLFALQHSRLDVGSPLWSEALNRVFVYCAIFGPLCLCTLMSIGLWERRPRIAGALSRLEAFSAGLFVSSVAFASVLVILLMGGNLAPEHPFLWPSLESLAGVLAGALLLSFQSGAEEWFFRGWLQPHLAAGWGIWPGLILTSVLFAAAHAFVNVHSVTGIANVLLSGLLFGLLALRTGGILAPIAAHWAWNWLEQSIVGLTPNPGVDALGSIFDLKLVGSPLAGAGADELDGALAVTVVFAAIVLMLALLPSSGATASAPAEYRSDRVPGKTP